MRKKKAVTEDLERYSVIRSILAIRRADVVLIVVDANEGITEQDVKIAGIVHDEGKPSVVVMNKWDLVKKEQNTMQEFEKNVRLQFPFLEYAPIVFVSAKTSSRVDTIFEKVDMVAKAYDTHIATSLLNDVIQDAQMMNEAPDFNGGRLKIYFVNQANSCPPTFVLFVNKPKYAHFSYLRYIENRLRDSFNLDGTPIDLVLRERV